jgi:hypothetical protein
MSNLNPYESPQSGEPTSLGQVAKRAGGIGIILLLTPLAVVIAFGANCTVAILALRATPPGTSEAPFFLAIPVVSFGVLVAMTYWAVWRHYRRTETHQRRGRITILLLTPLVVVAATGLEFAATYALIEWSPGEQYLPALTTFFATPLIALVAMLYLAWRCDRKRL